MKYPVEYYLNSFFSFYLQVYAVVIFFLLIGATFLKDKYKAESYNLLYTFNTLAAWSVLLLLLFFITELFVAWYGQNPYEWYVFRSGGNLTSLVWFLFKTAIVMFLGLLLFIRKLRVKRLFTSLFLLSLNIGLIERLIYFLFKNYLFLGWYTYYDYEYNQTVIKLIVIVLLIGCVYLIACKKKRLPYPSIFLK